MTRPSLISFYAFFIQESSTSIRISHMAASHETWHAFQRFQPVKYLVLSTVKNNGASISTLASQVAVYDKHASMRRITRLTLDALTTSLFARLKAHRIRRVRNHEMPFAPLR